MPVPLEARSQAAHTPAGAVAGARSRVGHSHRAADMHRLEGHSLEEGHSRGVDHSRVVDHSPVVDSHSHHSRRVAVDHTQAVVGGHSQRGSPGTWV